jgi:hypothetical protein
MAAKKTSKKAPSINKSAFVRSLLATMSGAEVVAKAKSQGVKISLAYVYGIRAKSNASKAKSGLGALAPVKRGPGRPRKTLAVSTAARSPKPEARSVGGLIWEIERIVEAKVAELLKARLGAIFK